MVTRPEISAADSRSARAPGGSSAALQGAAADGVAQQAQLADVEEVERGEEARAADRERGGGGHDRPARGPVADDRRRRPTRARRAPRPRRDPHERVGRCGDRRAARAAAASRRATTTIATMYAIDHESASPCDAEQRVEREREHDVDPVLDAVEQERRARVLHRVEAAQREEIRGEREESDREPRERLRGRGAVAAR